MSPWPPVGCAHCNGGPTGAGAGPGVPTLLFAAAMQGRGADLAKPRLLLPSLLISLNLSFLFCKRRVIVSPFGVIMRIG